jgi:hypothetical protein
VIVVAAPFFVPFLEAAINGRSVDLWPNPLFLTPLGAVVVGLLTIGLSFRRPKSEPPLRASFSQEPREQQTITPAPGPTPSRGTNHRGRHT